jgi:hypothetical protein
LAVQGVAHLFLPEVALQSDLTLCIFSFANSSATEVVMKLATSLAAGFLLGALGCLGSVRAGAAERTPDADASRDGQHDFDFNFGVWKTHIKRILNPLSGSSESLELNGTVTVRKVWAGRAQLEEIEAEGPRGHWEGLTLFLYDPKARQWSQTFASSADGVFSEGLIGSFKDGVGELFSRDTLNGRSILVRGRWSDITTNSHHFQEDYSDDGGTTWHPAFIANLTREPDTAQAVQPAEKTNPVSR